jgi:hypothetical protein
MINNTLNTGIHESLKKYNFCEVAKDTTSEYVTDLGSDGLTDFMQSLENEL